MNMEALACKSLPAAENAQRLRFEFQPNKVMFVVCAIFVTPGTRPLSLDRTIV